MPTARAERRSVFLFHHYTNEYLGGFWQNGSVTERNLLHLLNNILIDVKGDFEVRARHRGSGEWVEWCDDPVFQGHYSVMCKGEFKLNDEQWFVRLDSFSMSGGEEAFKNRIRVRDGRCVVSGEVNEAADLDIWAGYEAAHVFPLEYEEWWNEQGFGTCISDMDNTAGASKINSVQNGMLMTASLHNRFDQYLFTINPDVRHPTLGSTLYIANSRQTVLTQTQDGYKIVTFVPNSWKIDGRVLDPVCRQPGDKNRVPDELLRWHYRQSILGNIRREGEPVFEADFPPGTDQMKVLRHEPYGKQRFEMELGRRLRHMFLKEPDPEEPKGAKEA